MKTKIISLSFLFILIISSVALVHAQTSLSLTVTTNQTTSYDFYQPITISGSLSLNGLNPSDGLVGIQILYPSSGSSGVSMVLRTIETGTATEFSEPEAIASAYASDGNGNPVAGFYNDGNGYFSMTVANQDHQARLVLIAVSIYDGNGVPLGLYTAQVQIGKDASQLETATIPIPTDAHSGTAYGYADVYSDFPQNGGVPLAAEQPFTFQIEQGTGNSPATGTAPSNSGNAGAYSMTFKLPSFSDTIGGTYPVYASGTWSGYYGTATTSFNIPSTPAGDFNGDGVVDASDFFIFLTAYIASNSGQSYNTACDLGHDGKIDANDFFLFLSDYILYWESQR